MNAPEDRLGSKPVKLGLSKCSPVCPRKRIWRRLAIPYPFPAFRERCHRGLARLGIAVRRRVILMVPEGQRPHPRRTYRRCNGVEDAADHSAIAEHIEVNIVPLARWARSRCSLEDQLDHAVLNSPLDVRCV
jgi:hypothetical protein